MSAKWFLSAAALVAIVPQAARGEMLLSTLATEIVWAEWLPSADRLYYRIDNIPDYSFHLPLGAAAIGAVVRHDNVLYATTPPTRIRFEIPSAQGYNGHADIPLPAPAIGTQTLLPADPLASWDSATLTTDALYERWTAAEFTLERFERIATPGGTGNYLTTVGFTARFYGEPVSAPEPSSLLAAALCAGLMIATWRFRSSRR